MWIKSNIIRKYDLRGFVNTSRSIITNKHILSPKLKTGNRNETQFRKPGFMNGVCRQFC